MLLFFFYSDDLNNSLDSPEKFCQTNYENSGL